MEMTFCVSQFEGCISRTQCLSLAQEFCTIFGDDRVVDALMFTGQEQLGLYEILVSCAAWYDKFVSIWFKRQKRLCYAQCVEARSVRIESVYLKFVVTIFALQRLQIVDHFTLKHGQSNVSESYLRCIMSINVMDIFCVLIVAVFTSSKLMFSLICYLCSFHGLLDQIAFSRAVEQNKELLLSSDSKTSNRGRVRKT